MAEQDITYYDVQIDPGGDFRLSFTCYGEDDKPEDLTGAIVTGQLRQYPTGSRFLDFSCTHNGAGGQITADLPSEATAQITYDIGWYQIKVTFPDSTDEEVLHGKAFCTAPVTRKIQNGTPYTIIAFETFDKFPTIGNLYRLYLDQQYSVLYMWTGDKYIPLNNLKGDAATLDVGTVMTGMPGTPVEINNSGTIHAATFDFVIPRGNDGDGYCGADYDEANEGIIMEVSANNLGGMAFEDDAPADGEAYVRKDGAWEISSGGGGGGGGGGDYCGARYDRANEGIIMEVAENMLSEMAFVDDAPSDGDEYVRKNGQWAAASGGGSEFTPGDDLELVNGVLNIIKAASAQQDNTHPITAAAVYTEIGNINAILQTI